MNIGSAIEIREINAGFRKNGGSYIEWVYEGTQDAINSAFNTFISFIPVDDLLKYKVGGAMYRLTVRRDDQFTASPLIHSVRMQTHRVLKSIFEPPLPGILNTATDTEVEEIKEWLRNPIAGASPSFLVGSAGASALYYLALRGVNYRIVYQPHLIKQTTAINSYVWALSFSNIGYILDNATVVVDAGITTLLRFALPNLVSTDEDFVYGWLKHGPNVDPGPENTEIVTQEYEYGLWSTKMYPQA